MTTGLAIVTLIANALMGSLAFYNSAKARWIKISFGILVVISVSTSLIIIYQGNPVERVHFAITDFSPTTNPWTLVNKMLDMNVGYRNVGNGMATDTVIESYSVLRQDDSLFSQQQAVAEFEKWLKTRPLQKGSSIAKEESRFSSTKGGTILTPEDHANLMSGRKVLFIVGFIQFMDDFGKHSLRLCRFLQPPGPTGDGGIRVFGIMGICELEF